ncbi:MAG: hypothetical protein ACK5MR_06400 [Cumulibacter sp.]
MQWMWHLFWIIPVFGGVISTAINRLEAMNERRAERAQERYRLKQEVRLAKVQAQGAALERGATRTREVRALMRQHQETIDEWAAYELDPARMLEYPVMADVRDPLVSAFHHAMLTADGLRPGSAEDLTDRDDVTQYRDAVHTLQTAFRAAEAEALRRGFGDFDAADQAHLNRARKLFGLAADEGASAQERTQALGRGRDEINGIVVLPRRGMAALERKVAGAIEA